MEYIAYCIIYIWIVYAVVYVSWTDFSYWVNGGHWPYPILDVVFKKLTTKVAFVGVITLFMFAMSVGFQYAMSHAPLFQ